jgi:hypothetical protein
MHIKSIYNVTSNIYYKLKYYFVIKVCFLNYNYSTFLLADINWTRLNRVPIQNPLYYQQVWDS